MSQRHPAEVAADFATYPFFHSFDRQTVLQISTMASFCEFPANHFLLRQGEANRSLFFLHSGEAEILLDGEPIARLSQRGEVIGEMSVISGAQAATDVVCNTTVQCYQLPIDDFLTAPLRDRDHFHALLYRVFSDILLNRLKLTNQKARQFEIANRELLTTQMQLQALNSRLEVLVEIRTKDLQERSTQLEVSRAQLEKQNYALMGGFKRVSEVVVQQEKTLRALQSFSDKYVLPLQRGLRNLKSQVDVTLQTRLDQHLKEVTQLQDELVQWTQDVASKKEQEQRRILYVDADRKQQQIAKLALGGTGVELVTAGDAESALAELGAKKIDLLVCELQLAQILPKAKAEHPDLEIVLVTPVQAQLAVERLRELDFVDNVVSRDPEDRVFSVKNIVTTATKILHRDYFGLEKYLAWGVEVQELRLTSSSERAAAIEKMREYLASLGVRTTLQDRCSLVAEELLMNAIYDAPVGADGKSLFNHLGRKQPVELKFDQAAQFRFACDGNFIAVSVVDPFGSLPRSVLLDYLYGNYVQTHAEVNAKLGKGGAGRGLHQIVEHSDLTVFNVRKGYKTEAISLFHLDSSRKKQSEQSGGGSVSSFHLFFR